MAYEVNAASVEWNPTTERLRELTEKMPNSQVTEFGNVVVNFTRGEVTRAGKRIELTALEFKLLRAFLERAGAVLSLDQLIETVWGKDVFLTDRVIYTHVNNLRVKIEEDPSRPRHIVSLRGLGYRFDV